jgi:GNAT superfamily N-acetyltransferase
MQIRLFHPDDTPTLMQLFYETVHQVNCRDYSPEQLVAWAPPDMEEGQWRSRLSQPTTFVALFHEIIVGFCEFAADGHIGCFYTHYQHQEQGVGTALLEKVQGIAQQQQLRQLYTEASITARPFFEHHGFETLAAQQVARRGVLLGNFRMRKVLAD